MKLLLANAFQIPLADESVDMCVTSPPYYSLRKYAGEQEFVFGGDKDCAHEWGERMPEHHPGQVPQTKWAGNTAVSDGQTAGAGNFCLHCGAWRGAYGLEPTLEMYIEHTVQWCREVWRVLKPWGTFWLNLGDSYASAWGSCRPNRIGNPSRTERSNKGISSGLKEKDLMGVPWRVALALQADGWYLRSDIIWHKPNPMPESVTDRPTKSHEYIFLLSKQPKYFYDADSIREPIQLTSKMRAMRGNSEENKYAAGEHMPPGVHANTMSQPREYRGYDDMEGAIERGETPLNPAGRNRRTVWTITTKPYSGAHFATYPPDLVEPCIKAGTSEKGNCPECGKPWERVVEARGGTIGKSWHKHGDDLGRGQSQEGASGLGEKDLGNGKYRREFLGFRPTCSCCKICDHYNRLHGEDDDGKMKCPQPYTPEPAVVLDPFSGSGTTVMVANQLGREGIGLDISEEYIELAKERTGLKALKEWQHGKQVEEANLEGLPMFKGAL